MRTIIPAQPGWYLAILIEADDDDAKSDDHLELQPVIAWSIKHDENEGLFVLPITATKNVAQSELWAIKTPDGTFETVYGGTADTEEQTLQTLKQTAEHIRKQQVSYELGLS
jgi:hypothetical protein